VRILPHLGPLKGLPIRSSILDSRRRGTFPAARLQNGQPRATSSCEHEDLCDGPLAPGHRPLSEAGGGATREAPQSRPNPSTRRRSRSALSPTSSAHSIRWTGTPSGSEGPPIARQREIARGSRARAQDRQMRAPPALQNASKRLLIPVTQGKQEEAERQRGNDGWRATAELLRVQATNNPSSGRIRADQRSASPRRARKATAFVLFILFVIAAVHLNLLWLIEVPGLYLVLAAREWLPPPKRGPWSHAVATAAPRPPATKRRAPQRGERHAGPPGASAKPRQRRVRRGGRARRRARRPAGRP
jgi:hypothetical protein